MKYIITESQYKLLIEQTSSPMDKDGMVGQNCKTTWLKSLTFSKKYWIQWLSSSTTQQKFKKNWNIKTDDEVRNIFKKYIDAINNLTLGFYDRTTPKFQDYLDNYAFTTPEDPSKIYVNCSEKDPDPYGTLVHEIQHTLYEIKPLNPNIQVGSLFVNPTTKKMFADVFFPYRPIEQSIDSINMDIISKNVGAKVDSLKVWLYNANKIEKENPGYICSNTEKMSNIMSIRRLLNLTPNQNITKKMLLPYINQEKKDNNMNWLLLCWALKGFSDLGQTLNRINQLAYQNKDFDNKIV
jgi:hypothetical protein